MRWIKLGLAVLISFGIYKFRNLILESLVEAFYYAAGLGLKSIAILALVILSITVNNMRFRYVINLLKGSVSLWDVIKSYFIALTAVFSLVKFSDSVRIYHLEKKGVPFSYGMVSYVTERFFDVLALVALSAFFLGNYSRTGLMFVVIFLAGLFFLLKFSHILPDFFFFNIMRDFGKNLGSIIKPVPALFLSFLTAVSITLSASAISISLGLDFYSALTVFLFGSLVLTTSPTPAGIGVYEVAVPAYVLSLGVSKGVAVGGILVYRLFSLWLPALSGIFFLQREL